MNIPSISRTYISLPVCYSQAIVSVAKTYRTSARISDFFRNILPALIPILLSICPIETCWEAISIRWSDFNARISSLSWSNGGLRVVTMMPPDRMDYEIFSIFMQIFPRSWTKSSPQFSTTEENDWMRIRFGSLCGRTNACGIVTLLTALALNQSFFTDHNLVAVTPLRETICRRILHRNPILTLAIKRNDEELLRRTQNPLPNKVIDFHIKLVIIVAHQTKSSSFLLLFSKNRLQIGSLTKTEKKKKKKNKYIRNNYESALNFPLAQQWNEP